MTQNEAILFHLRKGEKLTPMDALNLPDVRTMKLSSRVGEIRKTLLTESELILDEWVTTDTDKKVKRYFLTHKQGQIRLF